MRRLLQFRPFSAKVLRKFLASQRVQELSDSTRIDISASCSNHCPKWGFVHHLLQTKHLKELWLLKCVIVVSELESWDMLFHWMKLVVSVENKRSAYYVNLTATEAVVISSSTCACLRKDGERISAPVTLPATSSTVLST